MPGPATRPGAVSAAQAEARFVKQFSGATGLSELAVRSWARAEGAYAANGTGGFNFLNVRARPGGKGYSGVTYAGTTSNGFAQFASPEDAAREAAYWVNRMPNYVGIRTAAGKGVGAELAAIARSPWDAGHYATSAGAGGKLVTAAKAESGGKVSISSIAGDAAALADPIGSAVSGLFTDLNPLAGVEKVAGSVQNLGTSIVEGALRIVVAGIVLALAAVLFYNGIRRLSGDRLPSGRDIRANAAAGGGPLPAETAAIFAA